MGRTGDRKSPERGSVKRHRDFARLRRPSKRSRLAAEAFALFVALPAVFLIEISRSITTVIILGGLAYVAAIIWRFRLNRAFSFGLARYRELAPVFVRFAVFAILTTIAVAVIMPEYLFYVVRENPRLWLLILGVYCCFSVYPQTIVYRGFFMERYRPLLRSDGMLVLANAIAFSWAHTLIANPLVYSFTFIGGILFSITYLRTRSLLAVAIEHALYGFWLFTVGLGMYFAFPAP